MPEGAERRTVAVLIPQIGKEGIDVLGLVVGPDRRIVAFTAGSVHQAAACGIDALRRADFRKGEHRIDDRIGRVEHQVLLQTGDQTAPRREFRVHIQRRGPLPGLPSAEEGAEGDLLLRRERQGRVSPDFGDQLVASLHALVRTGTDHRPRRGNLDEDGSGTAVPQHVLLTIDRGIDRRKEHPGQRKGLSSGALPVALDGQRPVEPDTPHALPAQLLAVGLDHRGNIPRETPHQRGVRIVGYGAQHRPDDIAVQPESAVGVHAVTHYDRDPQTAHFEVVPVRIALPDDPFDSRISIRSDPPAGPLRSVRSEERGSAQQRDDGGKTVFLHNMKAFSVFSAFFDSQPADDDRNGRRTANRRERSKIRQNFSSKQPSGSFFSIFVPKPGRLSFPRKPATAHDKPQQTD